MGDVDGRVAAAPGDEGVSIGWVDGLTSEGPERDEFISRLHAILLRIAQAEAWRRVGLNGIVGRELDDLAEQAADDALVSILRKVGEFRGDSKFTTWAYKFVVFEISNKVSRHAWRREPPQLGTESWDRLPERLGAGPEDVTESRELVEIVRAAVVTELTAHQRHVFAAIVLDGMPLDAVVAELGSNRNAVYKTMFDARRKVRAHLVTHGYIEPMSKRKS